MGCTLMHRTGTGVEIRAGVRVRRADAWNQTMEGTGTGVNGRNKADTQNQIAEGTGTGVRAGVRMMGTDAWTQTTMGTGSRGSSFVSSYVQ